jgi:hypothetical protein
MFTLTPFWSIGVITMKMINNTSMTSTIGVTLISELTSAILFSFAIASLSPVYESYRRALRRFKK